MPCWRSAIPLMRISARRGGPSTSGLRRLAASARPRASIAISISRSRPGIGSRTPSKPSRRRAPPPTTCSPSTSRPARGGEVSTEPVTAEVVEHINLNSSRSDKETVHLALGFDGAAPAYEPGDSLELFPHNDPAVVDAVLTAAGLKADDALRASLLTERDVTTLSVPMLEKFAAATGHGHVRQLLADGQARAWIEGRQLIDLLEAYPATLSAEQLTALTRPLPPRRLFDRLLAQGGRRRGPSARRGGALREPRPRPRRRRLDVHGRPPEGGRLRAGPAQAEQAFPAARPRRRRHHDRPRHRRRAVPRLRPGAPRRRARPAATGCSSATGASRMTSSTSSNGRTRSRRAF